MLRLGGTATPDHRAPEVADAGGRHARMSPRVDILLVDDHEENLLALEAILVDPSFNLVRASSGRAALKEVLRCDFALILLDVAMPDLDGYETAELIRSRERSRQTPIIFLTANDWGAQHVFRGYTVGAVDYLVGPVSGWCDPPAVLAEPALVVFELAVVDGQVPVFACTGADRAVDDDAEQPGPQ